MKFLVTPDAILFFRYLYVFFDSCQKEKDKFKNKNRNIKSLTQKLNQVKLYSELILKDYEAVSSVREPQTFRPPKHRKISNFTKQKQILN